MNQTIKSVVLSNTPLKIISLMLGFACWYLISQNQIVKIWVHVPVSFHGVPDHQTLECPETIAVNLAGKRADLYALDREHLAIHIDAPSLVQGKNMVTVTPNTLFLPDTIKLIHYKPSNVLVDLKDLSKEPPDDMHELRN